MANERMMWTGRAGRTRRALGVALSVVLAGGVWPGGQARAAGERAVIVERAFAAEQAPAFVENEFIVELTRDARRGLVVGADPVGPRVSNDALQATIDGNRVERFIRQFPTAKPQPVNGKFRDLTGYYKVRIAPGIDLDQAMAAFARNPHVDHVEKIGIHPIYDNCATGAKLSPNDTYYDNPPPTFNFPQWDLWDTNGIDADMAWSTETGDPSVIVVAMDSGVRYFHPDLGGPNPPGPADNSTDGNIWVNPGEIPGNGFDDDGNGRIDDVVGWDFVTGNPSLCDSGGGEDCDVEDNDPRDFNGHGTHTAGTMAAITNNAAGVAGVAGGFGDGTTGSAGNGARILCARVGWQDILGRGFVRMDYVAQAMQYVADLKNAGHNIAAVNCSWGTSNSGGIAAATDNVIAADVMVIHAAGNAGSSTPDYYGSRTDVLNVAATDQSGNRASFSNFGSWVDIAAPGVDIISTWHQFDDPGPNYVAVLSGTSMAAPHVAGVAALLESCNSSLSGPDKFSIMVNNGCAAGSSQIGDILNARLALDAAGCGGCQNNSECDDGNECTSDVCNAGVCENNPVADNTSCNGGAGICCSGSCTTAACSSGGDCDDADLCTTDTCNNAGTCSANCSNAPVSCPPGETCNPANGNCEPQDCDNDGLCESGEDCNNCPNDCISGGGSQSCGDGICSGTEDCVGCPADCNGKQNGNPDNRFCCNADGGGAGDGPVDCTDPRCNSQGFTCGSLDPFCCGDAVCEGSEDVCNCAIDCGAPGAEVCDNGVDDDCDGLVDCDDTADCPDTQPPCQSGPCAGNKDPCTVNEDCCSLNCNGGTCRGN